MCDINITKKTRIWLSNSPFFYQSDSQKSTIFAKHQIFFSHDTNTSTYDYHNDIQYAAICRKSTQGYRPNSISGFIIYVELLTGQSQTGKRDVGYTTQCCNFTGYCQSQCTAHLHQLREK